MKKYLFFAFCIAFIISLFLSSCNSGKKERSQKDKKNMVVGDFRFVGKWLNEKEMTQMILLDDNTCEIPMMGDKGEEGGMLKGKWKSKGDELTIEWEQVWNVSKSKTVQMKYVQKNEQELLQYDNNTQAESGQKEPMLFLKVEIN